jgi:hypothetical protein
MKNVYLLALLIIFFGVPVRLFSQSGGISGMPGKTYHWFDNDTIKLVQTAKPVTMHPPVFGKKRRNNGMILPLPFGAGVTFFRFTQPYTATDLEVENYNNEMTIKAELMDDNTTSGEINITVRPDLWLFPFLNVYGLFGYTSGSSNYDIKVNSFTLHNVPDENVTVDSSFTIRTTQAYSGPVYGFGTTVSTGYKGFYVLLNYEYNKTGRIDYKEKLVYQYFRAKAGILLGHNQAKAKGSFWLGTSYMHDSHYFEGLVETEAVFPGLQWLLGDVLLFTGNDKVSYPWNFLFGGCFNLNDHHIIVVELGTIHRGQLSFSYTYRF